MENIFKKFKKLTIVLTIIIPLAAGLTFLLLKNKPKEVPAGAVAPYVAPERNIESNIQYYDLRKDIDPIFNKVHDELSGAYYNKKPFRSYGILTKEQFDKLHGLIFLMRDVKFHEENLKLPKEQQIPESQYNYILDEQGKVIGKKSEELAKKIQELKNEGIELTIP